MRDENFFKNQNSVSEFITSELNKLLNKFNFIGCVRGIGLMLGLEIVKNKESKEPNPKLATEIISKCEKNGLLLRQSLYGKGSFVKIRPSFNISLSDARKLCQLLEKTLENIKYE